MQIWELFIIAVGLSMDAFAVAVCKGLSVRKVSPGHALTAGLYFGGFQALMPLLGYFLGTQFESLIQSVDHWIAFALLGLIGANMIRESRSESEEFNDSFGPKAMLPLGRYVRVFAGADRSRRGFHRRNYLCPFLPRREARQRIRRKI